MSGHHEQQDGLEQSGRPDGLDRSLTMTQPAGRDADRQNGHSHGGADAGPSRSAEPSSYLPDGTASAPRRASRSVFDPIPPADRSHGLLDPGARQERTRDAAPENGTLARLSSRAGSRVAEADPVPAEASQPPPAIRTSGNGLPHPEHGPDLAAGQTATGQVARTAAAEPTLAPEVPDSPGSSGSLEPEEAAGTQSIAAPSGSASHRHGRFAADSASRHADQPAMGADQPGPATGSLADLRQRLDRLPYGHPSSPFHDDGERRPPPPRLKHLALAPPAPERVGDRPAPAAKPFPAGERRGGDGPASDQTGWQPTEASAAPQSRGRRARPAQPAPSQTSSAAPDEVPSRGEPTRPAA